MLNQLTTDPLGTAKKYWKELTIALLAFLVIILILVVNSKNNDISEYEKPSKKAELMSSCGY
jgi:hypothetical protein